MRPQPGARKVLGGELLGAPDLQRPRLGTLTLVMCADGMSSGPVNLFGLPPACVSAGRDERTELAIGVIITVELWRHARRIAKFEH